MYICRQFLWKSNRHHFSSTPLKRRLTCLPQKDRLFALRQAMATSSPEPVDVFVVPTEDAHQSEYTAECDNRRAWISGFNGSAGCAIITQKKAALFTDGRYFLQASQELDHQQWTLMKQGLPGVPTWQEFLSELPNIKIGIDPSVITIDEAKKLEDKLSQHGSTLVPLTENLVDKIRGDTRPARPTNSIKVHDIQYAGKTHNTKLTELMSYVTAQGCDGTVVTSLDEIAWLLNLRGSDIHCCPVFFAYCVVTPNQTLLYINDNSDGTRLTNLHDHLSLANIQLRDYDQLASDIKNMTGVTKWFIDPHTTNLSIIQGIKDRVQYGTSMIPLSKAIKNTTELASTKMCHYRDGAAVSQHFAWLAHELCTNENKSIREYDAALHLESMRKNHSEYVGLAFDTIAATGPHGAIIHYQPSAIDSAVIDPRQLYLCDSGAQYVDGTTDITRTFLFLGQPSDFQKRAFTRVLQAHIALDQAIFPKKTTGYQLDTIARQPLWRDGLNYRHGTGHGVGAYLNVHEGPHGIGGRISYNDIPLEQNMLVTNEPGYYQDGEFGIRIENVLAVCQASTPYHFDGEYLGFEHLTFVPLGKKLIDIDLLDDNQIQWINDYHQKCRHILEPLLQGDRQTLIWLEDETEPLSK
ncbi:peptidase M24, structural domain-containing protein [Halteromyces radiatus]|uniref:peptidase M24, structural domain-containing protein n=1 Tax=Halteromyces radiatus TaxID=101107 RepID=UPI00222092ED|nr:peptidase M24, structural domain-containing protein [Halteromyces radiatus]KAI8097492.1 peptidase M24, structural domain-containing protein [Halteromyces radiatus]